MGLFYPALPAAGNGIRSVGPSTSSMTVAVAAHAAALVLLATVVPTERLAELARPLAVRLIELAPEAPPPPKPEPPKPQPRPKVPLAPPPILAVATPTPAASPAEFVVAPQPPAPPIAAPVAPVAPVVAAPPAPPAPITQARFDADYLKNPKPAYPASSRRLGEEGKVVLRVHVTPDGHPAVIEIKASSSFPRLDHAAREAVTQWRFVPAKRGEEPIAAWVLVPIVFSLES